MPTHTEIDFPPTPLAAKGGQRLRRVWPWRYMQIGDTIKVFVTTSAEARDVNNSAGGHARRDDPYFTLRTKVVWLPVGRSYVLVRAVNSLEESVEESAKIAHDLAQRAYVESTTPVSA